jgi:hypothetical protein
MAKKDSVKMLEVKIEVLKRARAMIKTGYYGGICSALTFCYSFDEMAKFSLAAYELRKYIGAKLGSSVYLESWLERKKPNLDRSDSNMKKYRLQWIDWMIVCLQEDLAAKQHKKG